MSNFSLKDIFSTHFLILLIYTLATNRLLTTAVILTTTHRLKSMGRVAVALVATYTAMVYSPCGYPIALNHLEAV